MRILIVEDSKRLQTYLRKGLRLAGCAVDVAGDGEEGLWLALENDYDVVILDLMLPKLDGISVLRQLRQGERKTHVLILTAKDAVPDRVHGLEQGADDYLVKPFAFEELLARVQALARRKYGKKNTRIDIGGLIVDTVRRVAARGDEILDLRPREYALLELLAFRQGELVTRTDIERHIYDELAEPASNVVDSAICLLRKKIDVLGAPSLIQTRRGLGYVLEGPRA
ncbi:MAG: response regulator transcription factor [Candidatus Hydrogenedentes bacterium]|nr:response regulator transcription factor [Candidatus Hydrogenedentota bacterium]